MDRWSWLLDYKKLHNSPKNWKLANFSESDNPTIIAKLIYTNRFQEFKNYLILFALVTINASISIKAHILYCAMINSNLNHSMWGERQTLSFQSPCSAVARAQTSCRFIVSFLWTLRIPSVLFLLAFSSNAIISLMLMFFYQYMSLFFWGVLLDLFCEL